MLLIFFSSFVLTVNANSLVGAEEFTVPEVLLFGDVDMDGEVTVKDATAIQKGIAELSYLTSVQRFLADPDKTGVTIKNATDIQKHVAKFKEQSIFIGKPVDLSVENEFSRQASIDADFEDDCILVLVKLEFDYDYTLLDFPEYDFKDISVVGEKYEGMNNAYMLYLNTQGKENVIKAIKALDYRANIDLIAVSPNYIFSID